VCVCGCGGGLDKIDDAMLLMLFGSQAETKTINEVMYKRSGGV